VAQIARSITRALGLDEDLAEALALSHDLGHTPFGHTGEDTLDLCMKPYGGFDHNAQALKIVTALEKRYPDFDGLNLTWETLEGLVKHNGPLLTAEGQPTEKYHRKGIHEAVLAYDRLNPLDLASFAGPEAQVAALSDDIAYNTHDIDDSLRAGFFDLEDLHTIPFIENILDEIHAIWPTLDKTRTIHELMRRLITRFVEGVIRESEIRLKPFQNLGVEAIRAASNPVVQFPVELVEADRAIKAFLFERVYSHKDVMRIRAEADAVLTRLFHAYFERTDLLPREWQDGLSGVSEDARAHRVADYIAGMTDRFALEEHRRLFDVTPELR
jgi:dGTPase